MIDSILADQDARDSERAEEYEHSGLSESCGDCGGELSATEALGLFGHWPAGHCAECATREREVRRAEAEAERHEQERAALDRLHAAAVRHGASTYLPLRMTGRCRNGFERDGGRLYHAVQADLPATPQDPVHLDGWRAALCGATPGRRGNGWSTYEGDTVTCPRCLSRLDAVPQGSE